MTQDALRAALDEGDALMRQDQHDLYGWVELEDALAQARLKGQMAAFGWLRNRLGLPPYAATAPSSSEVSPSDEGGEG